MHAHTHTRLHTHRHSLPFFFLHACRGDCPLASHLRFELVSGFVELAFFFFTPFALKSARIYVYKGFKYVFFFFFLWSALLVRDLFIQQENNERKDFKAKNEEKKKDLHLADALSRVSIKKKRKRVVRAPLKGRNAPPLSIFYSPLLVQSFFFAPLFSLFFSPPSSFHFFFFVASTPPAHVVQFMFVVYIHAKINRVFLCTITLEFTFSLTYAFFFSSSPLLLSHTKLGSLPPG